MKAPKVFTKDKYLDIPSLEALHHESREWFSDIAFWADEADFLKKLIDNNFVHLLAGENVQTLSNLSGQVFKMKTTELKNLKELVESHEVRLSEFLKKSYFHEEEAYRKEHGSLAIKVREMAMKNMALKRRIFGAAENMKMEERVKVLQ